MSDLEAGWEARLAALWAELDDHDAQEFVALAAGLGGERRRRATIQLASSLRNVGSAEEAIALLAAELDAATDDLDGAVRTFLALALVDVGREREAVGVALTALSGYLPRYNRSLARYARELSDFQKTVVSQGRPSG